MEVRAKPPGPVQLQEFVNGEHSAREAREREGVVSKSRNRKRVKGRGTTDVLGRCKPQGWGDVLFLGAGQGEEKSAKVWKRRHLKGPAKRGAEFQRQATFNRQDDEA